MFVCKLIWTDSNSVHTVIINNVVYNGNGYSKWTITHDSIWWLKCCCESFVPFQSNIVSSMTVNTTQTTVSPAANDAVSVSTTKSSFEAVVRERVKGNNFYE